MTKSLTVPKNTFFINWPTFQHRSREGTSAPKHRFGLHSALGSLKLILIHGGPPPPSCLISRLKNYCCLFSKFCVWAVSPSSSTNCGINSHRLLSTWNLMWCGNVKEFRSTTESVLCRHQYMSVCCCCVLFHNSERDAIRHPTTGCRLCQNSQVLQHWIWGTSCSDLVVSSDVPECCVLARLCCCLQPVRQLYQPKATTLWRNATALESDASVGALIGGSHVSAEAFTSCIVKRYKQKLVVCPTFGLWLFRRCLQRTASRVFGSLGTVLLTDFIVNRLQRA